MTTSSFPAARRARPSPGLAPDGDAVLDSTGVLNLPEVPESLIIVGAGAIGLELGDFFGMMGSKITIVEAAPHIAPTEDADIAKEMDRVQSKAGRTCITGVMAKSLVTKDGQAELTLGDGRVLTASRRWSPWAVLRIQPGLIAKRRAAR